MLRENVNLQSALMELMNSDDGYTRNQDLLVRNIYRLATESEKEIVDSIFVCICGYSLETILGSLDQEQLPKL